MSYTPKNPRCEPVHIDFFNDTSCQPCFVCKGALKRASAESRIPVAVRLLPFCSNPSLTDAGEDWTHHFVSKFGKDKGGVVASHDSSLPWVRMAREITERDGPDTAAKGLLPVRFVNHPGAKIYKTDKVHMLLTHEAVEADPALQSRASDLFMQAYFVDGVDLTQPANVRAVAKQAGLSDAVIDSVLVDLSPERKRDFERRLKFSSGMPGVPVLRFSSGRTMMGEDVLRIDTIAKVLEEEAGLSQASEAPSSTQSTTATVSK